MQTTLRRTQVLKITVSLSHGATDEEAETWIQQHANEDFHDQLGMFRKGGGGVIGVITKIEESFEPLAVPKNL